MNHLIDVHCHVLWGVDDGLKTFEEATKQLELAHLNKIRVLVATPHNQPNGKYFPSENDIVEKVNSLNIWAKAHQLDVEVKYGSEFMINDYALKYIEKRKYLCYQDTDYLLIEQKSKNTIDRLMLDVIDLLSYQQKKILIAHVERYFENIDDALRTCKMWKNRGAFLQINRTNILKLESNKRHKIAMALIRENLCHIVATDAHTLEGKRVCKLDDSYLVIKKKFGEKTADLLHVKNPKYLLDNLSLVDIRADEKKFNFLLSRKIRK